MTGERAENPTLPQTHNSRLLSWLCTQRLFQIYVPKFSHFCVPKIYVIKGMQPQMHFCANWAFTNTPMQEYHLKYLCGCFMTAYQFITEKIYQSTSKCVWSEGENCVGGTPRQNVYLAKLCLYD
ncbi:hypothetical protein POVCU1_040720 [Plasmodium ovale curtisi]|uniref:Uncharacterized protein n=1 Tax=Plasmodium ovale curtisi TaxID=864141 RepID=A0A1A8WXS0_PLAOA|nr:hypothetical protein POVCU1_040720 [Plasmodium ovale curtisi]